MREWTRLLIGANCGGCGVILAPDASVQMIHLPRVKRGLVRGECCAGPAPPTLPERVIRMAPTDRRAFTQRLERLSSVAGRGFEQRGSLAPLRRLPWLPHT